jgi:signal transduction histidine kinase
VSVPFPFQRLQVHASVPFLFKSLQARFLASLVLSVAAALATVAVVTRLSTTTQFERYVQQNHAEMQQVAETLALDTGQRVVMANAAGRVFLDSSNELLGTTVDPKADPQDQLIQVAPLRTVVFTRHLDVGDGAAGVAQTSTDYFYSGTAPAGLPGIALNPGLGLPVGAPTMIDPEELFLSSFSRSLLVGVLVGGLVALALAVGLSRGIVGSIAALTSAARHMANGRLDQRVRVHHGDEIGELGLAFNAMAEGLTRTEQLRRGMVADVAHELRTPLTNLRGYLEALRDGVTDPGPAVLASLYDEAVLLSQLVDDLQDLALSDAGQLTLHRELTDAYELVASAVRSVQPEAANRGVGVHLGQASASESVLVWADVRRVGQVLRNLLANALAYTPAGGCITVSTEARGAELTVRVDDTGPGIAAEHVPNLFERFYRVDSSRARATGGAGIGLAVVKQLVEAHGGVVGVRSVVGTGTTFSFTLPLALPV